MSAQQDQGNDNAPIEEQETNEEEKMEAKSESAEKSDDIESAAESPSVAENAKKSDSTKPEEEEDEEEPKTPKKITRVDTAALTLMGDHFREVGNNYGTPPPQPREDHSVDVAPMDTNEDV